MTRLLLALLFAALLGLIVGFALGWRAHSVVGVAAAPRSGPQSASSDLSGSVGQIETRTGAPLGPAIAPDAAIGDARPVGAPHVPAVAPTRPERTHDDQSSGLSSMPARPTPLAGWATWYRASRGFGGTAHVALPSGRWTGKIGGHAAVCVFADERTRCATLPVVDFCACGPRRGRPTVVDLSIEAVRLLDLDPGRGHWPATVEVVE